MKEKGQRSVRVKDWILWGGFGLYALVLLYILFLSRNPWSGFTIGDYFRNFTNFVPFRTVAGYIRSYQKGFEAVAIKNLLGNLLLFLPMGALLPFLFSRLNRFWRVLLAILGIIVAVELVQMLLRVGSIDIDDVILNLCGGMAGYPISKLPILRRIFCN